MNSSAPQPHIAERDASNHTARVVVCPACDWRYLFPPTGELPRCPGCHQAELVLLAEDATTFPYVRPLELAIPFNPSRLGGSIHYFIRTIPYPPEDLTSDNLQARLQKIFIPVWLVDVQVAAYWQGQAGFEVKTRSQIDKFHETGGWATVATEKLMLRWESRLGRLQRTYHNLEAPALESKAGLPHLLGQWSSDKAEPCTTPLLADAFIRLPERLPDDVWADVEPLALAAAEQECAQAAGAVQMRDFHWTPRYLRQNWTLLLYPLYTTFYYDDDGQPQVIMIHGETGFVHGPKCNSLKQAWETSKWFVIFAGVLFIMGLVWSFGEPEMALFGIFMIVGALGIGLGGLAPMAQIKFSKRSSS